MSTDYSRPGLTSSASRPRLVCQSCDQRLSSLAEQRDDFRSSVFLQRFDGAVTIWPRSRVRDWFRLLTDPDPPELERMIRVGQLVSWPKVSPCPSPLLRQRLMFVPAAHD